MAELKPHIGAILADGQPVAANVWLDHDTSISGPGFFFQYCLPNGRAASATPSPALPAMARPVPIGAPSTSSLHGLPALCVEDATQYLSTLITIVRSDSHQDYPLAPACCLLLLLENGRFRSETIRSRFEANLGHFIHAAVFQGQAMNDIPLVALWLSNAVQLFLALKSRELRSGETLQSLAEIIQEAFCNLAQSFCAQVRPSYGGIIYQDSLSFFPGNNSGYSATKDTNVPTLVTVLDEISGIMAAVQMDSNTRASLFEAIFCFISASVWNHIMNKQSELQHLFTCAGGLLLALNLQPLLEWGHRHHVAVKDGLAPLLSVVKLLQANKSQIEHLGALLDMDLALDPAQIRAVLQSYRPLDNEPQVLPTIKKALLAKAKSAALSMSCSQKPLGGLLLDTCHLPPFRVAGNHVLAEMLANTAMAQYVALQLDVKPSKRSLWTCGAMEPGYNSFSARRRSNGRH